MKKNLFSLGNGWAVYIATNVIKLLGINPKDAQLVFTIEDNKLFIKKITDDQLENIDNLLVRKFIKSGSGFALYIPNSVLELLEINPEENMVKLLINKDIMIIEKA